MQMQLSPCKVMQKRSWRARLTLSMLELCAAMGQRARQRRKRSAPPKSSSRNFALKQQRDLPMTKGFLVLKTNPAGSHRPRGHHHHSLRRKSMSLLRRSVMSRRDGIPHRAPDPHVVRHLDAVVLRQLVARSGGCHHFPPLLQHLFLLRHSACGVFGLDRI